MSKTARNSGNSRRGIDYIGVSAVTLILDGNGKFLLMKRGPKARDERGRWDICGGAIEFGESVESAIKREVKEELCVVPRDIKFLVAYDAHREHEGDKTHWIALVHTTIVDSDKVKIGEPDKISEIGWFTSSTLPEPLHSQFYKTFEPALKTGAII